MTRKHNKQNNTSSSEETTTKSSSSSSSRLLLSKFNHENNNKNDNQSNKNYNTSFPFYLLTSSSSATNKLILISVLSQFLPVPLLLLPFAHLVHGCFVSLNKRWDSAASAAADNENGSRNVNQRRNKGLSHQKKKMSSSIASGANNSYNNNASSQHNWNEQNDAFSVDEGNTDDEDDNDDGDGAIDIENYDPNHRIQVNPTPALTTLLDTGLYKAYQAELVPTVSAASQLLQLYIEMKESAALIIRECRWSVGVPFCGGLVTNARGGVAKMTGGGGGVDGSYDNTNIAIGTGSINVFLGGGAVVDEHGNNLHDGTDVVGQDGDDDGSGGDGSVHVAAGHFRRGTSVSFGSGVGDSINMSSINSTSGASGGGAAGSSSSSSSYSKEARIESMAASEIAKWNEFDTIHDFAQQCYLSANEAIQRLSTDRLSDSANLTVQESISSMAGVAGGAAGGGNGVGERGGSGGANSSGHHHHQSAGDALHQSQMHQSSASTTASSSSTAQSSSSMSFRTLADAGIGRYYEPLTRQNCWESPRLYCPDYTWADDAIGACQRSLKTLSKHRFITLVTTNGWDRYTNMTIDGAHVIPTPMYASSTPHPFPSLEAVHCLQYLVSELLHTSIPSSINKFRAATEANAVVSKRLYLVKCEYRAPMRALWESYTALNAAPRLELVEAYLRDYHGVKSGEDQDSSSAQVGGSGRSSILKKKLSSDERKLSVLLQQQREKMEKLITEKYWKHPILVEALQLERCCEKLEMDMSQMLLPLANLAREIMDEWKGRLRALASVREDDFGRKILCPHIKWQELPYWRELLRRLKSILCRKPGHDESTGIRPFLLDLQGVPRHSKDVVDSSIEIPIFPPLGTDLSNLEVFVQQVQLLQKVLNIPGMPVLAEERLSGSKSDKATMHELVKKFNEVWDEEMFVAQYKDWFDLVTRQQELNAGTVSEDGEQQPSLTELSEAIRETEIELSIAMASKDQLEMVRKRLEDLRSSKSKRHAVLASIVQDVAMRELNELIIVSPPEENAVAEFPELSELGLFGEQLTMSGEVLPLG